MSVSSATLSTVPLAGAAAYAADSEVKNAVRDYAALVSTAMNANPYGFGNDSLIDNWKVVTRLSQTASGIEHELRKVHRVASELMADAEPSVGEIPELAAPTVQDSSQVALGRRSSCGNGPSAGFKLAKVGG